MFKFRSVFAAIMLVVLLSLTSGQVSHAIGSAQTDPQGAQLQSYAPAVGQASCDPNFTWDPQLDKCVCLEPRVFQPWSGQCKEQKMPTPEPVDPCYERGTVVDNGCPE